MFYGKIKVVKDINGNKVVIEKEFDSIEKYNRFIKDLEKFEGDHYPEKNEFMNEMEQLPDIILGFINNFKEKAPEIKEKVTSTADEMIKKGKNLFEATKKEKDEKILDLDKRISKLEDNMNKVITLLEELKENRNNNRSNNRNKKAPFIPGAPFKRF